MGDGELDEADKAWWKVGMVVSDGVFDEAGWMGDCGGVVEEWRLEVFRRKGSVDEGKGEEEKEVWEMELEGDLSCVG